MLVVVSLCGAGAAAAQSADSRVEVGVQASILRLSDFERTNAGIGGRLSFELARWISVEGEANFFPNDDILQSPSLLTPNLRVAYERQRADAFVGVKVGRRSDRFGVFAKVRPGFTRLSDNGSGCAGSECPLVLLVRPEYRPELALDLGGVFEWYPSARTVARFELGDTIVRHRSVAPPCWFSTCTSHNLSSRVGVGLRF